MLLALPGWYCNVWHQVAHDMTVWSDCGRCSETKLLHHSQVRLHASPSAILRLHADTKICLCRSYSLSLEHWFCQRLVMKCLVRAPRCLAEICLARWTKMEAAVFHVKSLHRRLLAANVLLCLLVLEGAQWPDWTLQAQRMGMASSVNTGNPYATMPGT